MNRSIQLRKKIAGWMQIGFGLFCMAVAMHPPHDQYSAGGALVGLMMLLNGARDIKRAKTDNIYSV